MPIISGILRVRGNDENLDYATFRDKLVKKLKTIDDGDKTIQGEELNKLEGINLPKAEKPLCFTDYCQRSDPYTKKYFSDAWQQLNGKMEYHFHYGINISDTEPTGTVSADEAKRRFGLE